MNDFARLFLNEDWETLREAPRIYVGAFGKHPGWNDHIDDIGLVTQSLVLTRRLLYGSGIASQIESASWDKAGPGKTLPGFDHLLLWRRGSESIIGRIWSSRDGKGRSLYPMIVAIHAVGQSFEALANGILPVLRQVEEKCVAAPNPADVMAALSQTQQRLRARLTGADEPLAVPDSPLGMNAWQSWFAADRDPLERLMCHLRRQLGVFAPNQHAWCDGEGAARSRTLRLPVLPNCPAIEACNAWLSFLATQLNAAVPLLALVPRDQPWIDVVVGEPAPADFFVLRANLSAVPLVTDIPYQPEPDERARFVAWAAEVARRGRATTSLLNGETVAQNRLGADKWLARFRSGGGGFLNRLLSSSGSRGTRFFFGADSDD